MRPNVCPGLCLPCTMCGHAGGHVRNRETRPPPPHPNPTAPVCSLGWAGGVIALTFSLFISWITYRHLVYMHEKQDLDSKDPSAYKRYDRYVDLTQHLLGRRAGWWSLVSRRGAGVVGCPVRKHTPPHLLCKHRLVPSSIGRLLLRPLATKGFLPTHQMRRAETGHCHAQRAPLRSRSSSPCAWASASPTPSLRVTTSTLWWPSTCPKATCRLHGCSTLPLRVSAPAHWGWSWAGGCLTAKQAASGAGWPHAVGLYDCCNAGPSPVATLTCLLFRCLPCLRRPMQASRCC